MLQTNGRTWLFSEMKQMRFHFVAFEHMIELEGRYIPLEVGLVEWCMERGITKELHAFIYPGMPSFIPMRLH